MNNTPLLQIAMDYTSLPKALAMAVLVAPEVDIIEIGTPLCKAAGMEAVRAMREICPDKLYSQQEGWYEHCHAPLVPDCRK